MGVVQVGIKVALIAANALLTPKIEGPRLDSLDVTTADFGTPLIRFWGKRRLEGVPIFWAEKLREKKTTSKTKGGKYSEYKYFGTFAVIIADHQIDAVSRIWMDKHMVLDMTGAGPISVLGGLIMGATGAGVKITQGKNMRVYLGNQIEPDPRMEAWCEDRYGPDTCPAYKDVSYIVFEDLPLEKFGNRIPQVTVEAINDSNTNYLYDNVDLDSSAGTIRFSPDYSRFWANNWLWDTATRTPLVPVSFEPEALGPSGVMWQLTDTIGASGGPFLTRYNNDGQNHTEALVCPFAGADRVVTFLDGKVFVGSALSSVVQYPNGATVASIDTDFLPTSWAQSSDGSVWTAGKLGSVGVHLKCVGGPSIGATHELTTSSTDFPHLFFNSRDEFVIEQAGLWTRLNSAFVTLQTATLTSTGNFYQVSGSDRVWRTVSTSVSEINISDLATIRTINQSNWSGASGNINSGVYDPVNHAILSVATNKLVWRFLDRVGSDGTLLADVVSDVAGWCGVEDFDVSDLDQTVPGYSVTQGSGKDMLAPLLDIHDVDARPHDFSVQFIKRGDSASGTIPVTEFVREGDEPRYQITIKQDTDLPRKVSLTFADNDKDQQKNTVISQRPSLSVDCVRELTIDLSTYVATPGDAQKFSDRYHRRQWIGREGVNNSLTAQYLKLEPGDVWNLQLDDVTQTHKLTKMTLSQGRINTEWERDFPSLAVLGTGEGAVMDGRDDDEILVASPTKGFVKDIPLTEDAHASDLPLLYYGAGDYPNANFWPGATIYEGDTDGDDYLAWKGVEPADKASWGYATDVLDDAEPWLWDRGNSVNVSSNAALTSVTEAEIDADPTLNLALLGEELINFVTATLESDGTYTLSGFKRGRRGTEWATADHAEGDEFVLIETLGQDGIGLSDVGLDLFYKAQTVGRDLFEAAAIEVDFNGNTLRPYAPARIKWTTDGTDLFGEIIRRTRIGGAWVGGSTIPVSEASEAYEVDIYHLTTFKRTISVSGTNTFTYTAAQMATDSNSVGTPPPVEVYQMSDAVGRGFALAA